ncbi:transposase [Streptomyces atratus]|uniref:transposase n=1 Tax=Streptomyces atratus TaxID=1893 RepID=UPI00268D246C
MRPPLLSVHAIVFSPTRTSPAQRTPTRRLADRRLFFAETFRTFRRDCLHQLPMVEQAMGKQAQALLQQLDATCRSVDDLTAATEEAFLSHSDSEIIISFPGLSVMSGARVLAEVGDDRERFANPRALKAYAGAAPATRASGRSHVVVARAVKNQRLASAGYMWAFRSPTLTRTPRALRRPTRQR